MPVQEQQKYRLVTRSDMDGLICAVLLRELDLIDDILFVHPKDMQDGKVAVTDRDIVTNLPYVEQAHLVFDHHLSETVRNEKGLPNHVIDAEAPSAARVVYRHYGGSERFSPFFDDMMAAVDKADSAQFTMEDVLEPKGWELLSFLMDARTGLGRFREFRISNYNLMMDLIERCKHLSIEEVLELPDVVERRELYSAQAEKFKQQLLDRATVHGNVVVLDLRDQDPIWAGNRFMIYALFPQCNISIHVIDGFRKQNTSLAIGKSIFNRTSRTNIGEIALQNGGGGHMNAGTCQVANEEADAILKTIVARLNEEG
ncbi:MAG: exopolyphosphatase [Candidatus Sericytochromatia bacterium]|nr:exopolyphosphatase [Candidatus Sericytochromatia bacterium]